MGGVRVTCILPVPLCVRADRLDFQLSNPGLIRSLDSLVSVHVLHDLYSSPVAILHYDTNFPGPGPQCEDVFVDTFATHRSSISSDDALLSTIRMTQDTKKNLYRGEEVKGRCAEGLLSDPFS